MCCYSSTQEAKVPSLSMTPAARKGLPLEIKHKYQPRIQEWGLTEARVGVHWAAGGEIAQRESTYEGHGIREREQEAHPRGGLGHTHPPHPQTTPTTRIQTTLKKGPL